MGEGWEEERGKGRREGMAKGRRKKTSRRRRIWFLLLLVAAGVAFWGRHDLLWGGKGLLFEEIDFVPVEGQSDLAFTPRARPAEIVGIPDYKHVVRFPYDGKTLSCYRMVGFGNRLVVCSETGLKSPEAIDEIIKERRIRGRLEGLKRSPLHDRLQRIFLKVGDIHLAGDAFLLSEDSSPLPSPVKLGILTSSLILCCFSAYRLIK